MCARLSVWFRSADIVASRPRVELQECGQGDVDIPYLLDCVSVIIFHAYDTPSAQSIHRINREIIKLAAVVASAAGAGMAVPFTFCITSPEVI
ncbi:hypothetical protein ABVT39_019111 [Epinephelus coioides]